MTFPAATARRLPFLRPVSAPAAALERLPQRPLERDREAAADETLIAWAAEGDRLAFGTLAARHLPRLHGLALRITGSAAEAEDVAQEALLRAWQHAARFDPARAKLSTWLYRIAANLAVDQARRRQGQAPQPLEEGLPDPAIGPEEALAARQRQALLAEALAALPPRQRAALALAHDQGLSGAEAAAVLETSERAVEGLLHRARRFLAGRLREATR
ncbi:sigma-70 family RNA polymerase sigma factor [Roseomonas sp. GC11]|uniref:sigma-70 family RNA polymerase sigma factor n=1 Tax=Roseomonas sp. GC11 TaxID=2950546 RepID=UPI00210D090B|nr:sigma-70 family RNA polymerase sigma factor [Roseomonas sp. GC11]MCQ4162879.1 sigma-70 family RNA polymerase sigma factor [Roseomonas sp. GC11]